MSARSFYEALSADYDRFVDWKARLRFEWPFFERVFRERDVRTVLDVACGTGHHAIAFGRAGYIVSAVDVEEAMVRRARANAQAAGVTVDVRLAGFGGLSVLFAPGSFDAMTCLGNSLPHLLTEETLTNALRDMAAVLKPGGTLIIQNRNWDRVLAQRERFMPPEVHRLGEEEWIFWRFYDFSGPKDRLGQPLRFNMVRLHRQGEGPWSAEVSHTRLRAWTGAELLDALKKSGFPLSETYGSYQREPVSPDSPDLIVLATRHVS